MCWYRLRIWENLDTGMKGTMAEYEVASVVETAIMDVYPYTADKDANPEFSDEKKKQE